MKEKIQELEKLPEEVVLAVDIGRLGGRTRSKDVLDLVVYWLGVLGVGRVGVYFWGQDG